MRNGELMLNFMLLAFVAKLSYLISAKVLQLFPCLISYKTLPHFEITLKL